MHFAFQFVPLKAWLYREGFARFSNTRYSLSTIDDKCILLHRQDAEILTLASPPLLWKLLIAIWSWGNTKSTWKCLFSALIVPYLLRVLLSASPQTCTSPMLPFKKLLQIMTQNRCVAQKSHRSCFIPPETCPCSSLLFVLQRYASGRCSISADTSLPSTAERGSGHCLKTSIIFLCAASKVSRRSS